MEMTRGRGPDRCIDAVGCEAHAPGTIGAVAGCDHVSGRAVGSDALDHPGDHVLPQGGHGFHSGVDVGMGDKIPLARL